MKSSDMLPTPLDQKPSTARCKPLDILYGAGPDGPAGSLGAGIGRHKCGEAVVKFEVQTWTPRTIRFECVFK